MIIYDNMNLKHYFQTTCTSSRFLQIVRRWDLQVVLGHLPAKLLTEAGRPGRNGIQSWFRRRIRIWGSCRMKIQKLIYGESLENLWMNYTIYIYMYGWCIVDIWFIYGESIIYRLWCPDSNAYRCFFWRKPCGQVDLGLWLLEAVAGRSCLKLQHPRRAVVGFWGKRMENVSLSLLVSYNYIYYCILWYTVIQWFYR